MSLARELDTGRAVPEAPAFVPAADDDPLAALIYTSGSTGTPKGAMYTTDMMTRMWQRPRGASMDIDTQIPAIYLQYMPLSHVYGLAWLSATLASGGIGYFTAKSDMSTLFDDIGLVRPTTLNLVPRDSRSPTGARCGCRRSGTCRCAGRGSCRASRRA